MHSEPILRIENLSKRFSLFDKPIDRLKEALTGRSHHRSHQALDGISLTLRRGESIGIIGQNGAGKSTLLKLVTGVLEPDNGVIQASGRIAGLLELGTGFDMEASGRDNIAINGHLLGLSPSEIAAITPEVIAFSELGAFIDSPMRSYSSGMQMRLGFSIAAHCNPTAFIVDEALSVGDARFQQKCMQRIRDYQRQGGALLFVSHDLNAIRLLCQRAIVLHQGKVLFDGAPEEAVRIYYKTLPSLETRDSSESAPGGYGSKNVQIQSLTWVDSQRQVSIKPSVSQKSEESVHSPIVVSSGEQAHIKVKISSEIVFDASVGILIRDRFGQDIFGVNTAMLKLPVSLSPAENGVVNFTIDLDLAPGAYTVTTAVHTETTHIHDCQHWWDNALEFEVVAFQKTPFSGIVGLSCQAAFTK